MGDDKYYTVQIRGKAYRFKPIPDDDLERAVIVLQLNASDLKSIKGLTKALANSAGPDQWDEITDRYVAGEIKLTEFTSDVFKKLLKRQRDDADRSGADDSDDE